MSRCSYRYPDGAQCMYDDKRLVSGEACDVHRLLLKSQLRRDRARERNKAKVKAEGGVPTAIKRPKKQGDAGRQRSRVQSQRQIIDKLPPPPPMDLGPAEDPSAPWCTCVGRVGGKGECRACRKVSWMDWREGRVSG